MEGSVLVSEPFISRGARIGPVLLYGKGNFPRAAISWGLVGCGTTAKEENGRTDLEVTMVKPKDSSTEVTPSVTWDRRRGSPTG